MILMKFSVIDKGKKTRDEYTEFYNDTAKIMLIWKDYPKTEQLVKIVRTYELRNGRKYIYDKNLLLYIKNITKKTV